jgi:hypothetical protein
MSTITPKEFAAKWSKIALKEQQAAQSHFNDVCRLIGHPTPLELDPQGDFFTFEMVTDKAAGAGTAGGKGRADAYYQGRFIWEYKGPHANLDKAYEQLLLYRESLGNPYLLITSDLKRILIHTNFPNTVKEIHEISLERIAGGDGAAVLKRAFTNPESFQPTRTQEIVTRATADAFVAVVNTLQKWGDEHGNPHPPEQLAHFVIRLLFCLFAEDLGLLPNDVFTSLIQKQGKDYYRFTDSLRALFGTMKVGGSFGTDYLPNFNGGLFDDEFVPEMPSDIVDALLKAAKQDWSAIDPSIFGTLFERVIDESKRAQLGAHYTSKDDIMLIVEPVLMKPLRDKWQAVRLESQMLLNQGHDEAAHHKLAGFAAEIAGTRVLDPACGSGNFLYVALRQLLGLQKEVITFALRAGLPDIPLTVGPEQLYGIEINPYAHELAQVTVWIGYLQWRQENGFGEFEEPILRPLDNIELRDAILAFDVQGKPIEPHWPETEVVIGNPPFLGGNKIRQELGDHTVDSLFRLYASRVPAFADLVCYWFERARAEIEDGKANRAGLIATNSIRGGANRSVLERIKRTGEIFMAWSDNPWVLDGAAVRVSIVGFDGGTRTERQLDGRAVPEIYADLTSQVDLSATQLLKENEGVSFMGPSAKGPFDIDHATARKMLEDESNGMDSPNSDVVRPVASATDLVKQSRGMWTIDFGHRSLRDAERYRMPFDYVKEHVYPVRSRNRRKAYADRWWQYAEARPGMRSALSNLRRFIATPGVSKHRIYVWVSPQVLCNQGTLVFARDDDYFFGVLHSKVHELWALRQGTWLGKGNDPRYTPTTTFETFPFPWPPGREPGEDDPRVFAIATAARQLDAFRERWLHPPEDEIGITIPTATVKRLTLTNLYNALALFREKYKGKLHDHNAWRKAVKNIITLGEIAQLDYIHNQLDAAVLAAYGWPATLSDEDILTRLLALNLERAAGE